MIGEIHKQLTNVLGYRNKLVRIVYSIPIAVFKFGRVYLANIDDREAVWGLVENYKNITILGDKGYANKYSSPDLYTEKGIQLIFIKRDNTKNPHPKWLCQHIFRLRRRIETIFSQLAGERYKSRIY